MIRIRLDKNRIGEPVFKIGIPKEELNNRILKRAIMEGKSLKGIYNYKIPMRYFIPIFNNLGIDNIIFDTRSLDSYLEFADECEENFYYAIEATPKYMRKWREENCPNIFKIEINKESMVSTKRIAFKKIKV